MLKQLFKNPLFLLALAFGLGCAAHAVTTSVRVAAQTDPTRGIYRECFGVTLYSVTGRKLNQGELPDDLVRIPDGWHVAGGGGGTSYPFAILCR